MPGVVLDYPITPSILDALKKAEPDVVVISGWSIAQRKRPRVVPPAPRAVRAAGRATTLGRRPAGAAPVKTTAVPPILRSAASVLVVGSLARESVVALGADPPHVRVFANTIDVTAWAERADELAGRRSELRAAFGLAGEVAVLSVARLAPEKGLDVLLRAATAAAIRRCSSAPDRACVPRDHRAGRDLHR